MLLLAASWLAAGALPPETVARARYLALTARPHTPAPVAAVDLIRGPTERMGRQSWQWWQLEARSQPEQTAAPLFVLRALTSADPLAGPPGRLEFAR